MIVAVLDTNVRASAIAGLLQPGSLPGGVLRAWHSAVRRIIDRTHDTAALASRFRSVPQADSWCQRVSSGWVTRP